MANIGDLVVHLDANTAGLESGLDRATKATGRYRDAAGRMREANGRFVSSATLAAEAMGKTATQTARASSGFGRMARQSQLAVPPLGNLVSLLGTLSGYLGARQVIQYADAWNNAANQLRQVTDTAGELASVQETLMGVANETRSQFESTANLYSRLSRATTEMGLSQKDLIGLTKTINQSFAVSGATAGEAAAAITQLSQGLASGALRGDEFNSVAEQAPAIMRAITDETGKSIGELRDFAAEGGITAKIVVDALQGAANSIEDDFGKAVATFGQQMTVARNNMLQFVGGSNDLNEALSNLGDAAITLSENLDLVVKAAGVLSALFAGRLIGRLVAVAAGMRSAASAAVALRTALAFLGGPAGIAVAAAGAIFTFREELGLVAPKAKTAAEELKEVTEAIDGMGSAMLDLQVAAFGAEMLQMNIRAQELKSELEDLQEMASSDRAGAGQRLRAQMGVSQSQRELESIEARREAIGQAMEGLDQFRTASEDAATGADRLGESTNGAADALDKFSARMSPEIKDILDRAGPGATIDDQGRIRDAFGNFNRILQRELNGELKSQINEFSAEKNLMAGLEAAAQKFVDGASGAATKAWKSVTTGSGLAPTGNQSSVPELATTGRAASTAMQSADTRSGKNLGTLKLASENGGTIDVQANAERLTSWLADTLSGQAASA